MAKAVLISIQPKWCELIANSKKTLEIRKNKPNIETPFKVYIYCTNTPQYHHLYDLRPYNKSRKIKLGCVQHNRYSLVSDNYINGKVIGEFVCDRITTIKSDYVYSKLFGGFDVRFNFDTSKACLEKEQIIEYLGDKIGDKTGYAWHITDLKIYDKPKELSEFKTFCRNAYCQEVYGDKEWFCKDGYASCAVTDKEKEFPYNEECIYFDCPPCGGESCEYEDFAYCLCKGLKPVTKAPQSWCYVEVE